jgi:negative regulator of flagellin synthesis FlgM
MSIGNVTNTPLQAVNPYERVGGVDAKQSGAVSGVGRVSGFPGSPNETVDFSTESQAFVQAKSALARVPDVREEKVQALKAQIQSGSYRVDSARVAEKMAADALVDIFA